MPRLRPIFSTTSTSSTAYLPKIVHCSRYINADLIAAGLSPLAPERELVAASRIFLQEIENSVLKCQDFAFETTLAGKSYLKLVRRLQQLNWHVELIYLALPSVEMSKARVAERVAHGGHDIPVEAIERRFSRSLCNLLHEFSFVVDNCACFMNINTEPTLIFEQQGTQRDIIHNDFYNHLLLEANS
jgi:predicted ABC-type ATPase